MNVIREVLKPFIQRDFTDDAGGANRQGIR
jgi:hypothetical protein